MSSQALFNNKNTMITTSAALQFFINLSKIQSVVTRRFDGRLNGLGWTDFIILLNLSQAPDEKLRRIDLAERVGLTASGVTRVLLPMEKIGLVTREINENDARVSFVVLAPGGKEKLFEALERAEYLSQSTIPASKMEKIGEISETLNEIGGAVMWN